MKDEIKEILDKLSNRKQETLIMGLRQCQLKNIEHLFITKEEYIDEVLNYITNLQEENRKRNNDINELQQWLNYYKYYISEINKIISKTEKIEHPEMLEIKLKIKELRSGNKISDNNNLQNN